MCCHMKNFCCLFIKQFRLPAKHFFLKNIYLGVAKGLQFSRKAKRREESHTQKGKCGSVFTKQLVLSS